MQSSVSKKNQRNFDFWFLHTVSLATRMSAISDWDIMIEDQKTLSNLKVQTLEKERDYILNLSASVSEGQPRSDDHPSANTQARTRTRACLYAVISSLLRSSKEKHLAKLTDSPWMP